MHWIAGARYLTKMRSIEYEGANSVKVGVIQYIGGLDAELNVHPLISRY